MSTPDPAVDEEEERTIGRELERMTPEPRARWRSGLAIDLGREVRRRAVGAPRPSRLWLRAGGLIVLGLALLALALAQA